MIRQPRKPTRTNTLLPYTTLCRSHLRKATNPHILTLAPQPSLNPRWWGAHTGYTLAKMGMSFVTLGLAAEFSPQGVAVNALWPRTLIATDEIGRAHV